MGQGPRPEIEWRQLEASAALAGCLDWPGAAAQVCRSERRRRIRGRESAEVGHAITGLGPDRATTAADLLALPRAPWGIENRLPAPGARRHSARGRPPGALGPGAAGAGGLPQRRAHAAALLRRLGAPMVEGIEPFQDHRRAALNLVRFGRIE